MFGVKRFTSKSDKADIFLEDIHLSILKEQLVCWLCLIPDSVKHLGIFTVMDVETT